MVATSTTDTAADVRGSRDPYPFCSADDLRRLDPALVAILAPWAAAHRAWRHAEITPGRVSPECRASCALSEALYTFLAEKAESDLRYFTGLSPVQVWFATQFAFRSLQQTASLSVYAVLRGATIDASEALEEWHLQSTRYTERLAARSSG